MASYQGSFSSTIMKDFKHKSRGNSTMNSIFNSYYSTVTNMQLIFIYKPHPPDYFEMISRFIILKQF